MQYIIKQNKMQTSVPIFITFRWIMSENNNERLCLLDENKICDDCGECDRCDLDPNKICDNCCKCLAIEDAGEEFRTVTIDGKTGAAKRGRNTFANSVSNKVKGNAKTNKPTTSEAYDDEPIELTPELVAYWEQKLREYGEAPSEDGFGEIAVSQRVPVKGVRKLGSRHAHGPHTKH